LMSSRADIAGRTYHVIQPEPLEWDTLFENLRRFGYEVPSVPW
jgi:phthiocerol/phenolphthiocerol synthesis type-I polyketide synthase E